jgi:polysaccharide export outer membrane protein
MNRLIALVPKKLQALVIVFGIALVGCDTLTYEKPDTSPKPPETSSDLLRVGDKIRIVYLDIPDAPTPTEQQIPEDGKLLLPKGVEITLANKRRTDVEKEIQDLYVKVRRLYPRMTVNIERQNLVASVGGEVRNPSFIPISAEMTVTRAINAAGGFTDFAKKTNVRVTRATTKQQIIVNVEKALENPGLDIPIYPGDVIEVKRRRI